MRSLSLPPRLLVMLQRAYDGRASGEKDFRNKISRCRRPDTLEIHPE